MKKNLLLLIIIILLMTASKTMAEEEIFIIDLVDHGQVDSELHNLFIEQLTEDINNSGLMRIEEHSWEYGAEMGIDIYTVPRYKYAPEESLIISVIWTRNVDGNPVLMDFWTDYYSFHNYEEDIEYVHKITYKLWDLFKFLD
ncbi:MAG: hypothetical protein ACOC2J_04620 [bacterium]